MFDSSRWLLTAVYRLLVTRARLPVTDLLSPVMGALADCHCHWWMVRNHAPAYSISSNQYRVSDIQYPVTSNPAIQHPASSIYL